MIGLNLKAFFFKLLIDLLNFAIMMKIANTIVL